MTATKDTGDAATVTISSAGRICLVRLETLRPKPLHYGLCAAHVTTSRIHRRASEKPKGARVRSSQSPQAPT